MMSYKDEIWTLTDLVFLLLDLCSIIQIEKGVSTYKTEKAPSESCGGGCRLQNLSYHTTDKDLVIFKKDGH